MKKVLSILLAFTLLLGDFVGLNLKADPIPESTLDILWTEHQFEQAYKFCDGLARVKNPYSEITTGYINKKGEMIVPIKYFSGKDFSEGLAAVGKGNYSNAKYGYIDKNGKEILEFKYDKAGSFSSGLALVGKKVENPENNDYGKYKYGYIDKTGKQVVDFIYDNAADFSEGLAVVVKDGKMGYIDNTGKVVIPFKYDSFTSYVGGREVLGGSFSDGMAVVSKKTGNTYPNGREEAIYGYIDKTGNEILPVVYDKAKPFTEGMTYVIKDDKKGFFIDKSGKIFAEMGAEYSFYGFSEGIAFVSYPNSPRSEARVYKDKEGNFLTDGFDYFVEDLICEGFGAAKKMDSSDNTRIGRESGYLDNNGQVAIPFIFEEVTSFSEGYALVKKDGKWGILKNPLGANVNTQVAPAQTQTAVNNNQVTPNAKYSKQNITVNGELIKDLEVYNIDGHNYFKLRDIAKLADGKEAKFSVNWNGEKQLISIKTGEAYEAKGTELKAGDGTDKLGTKSTAKVEVNGEIKELNAYTIQDQNYFEIRPLGEALNFGVEWNDKTQTVELKM